MKNVLLALLCLPFLVFAQEEKKAPKLYEVVDVKVKRGQEDAFEAAVKEHNKNFHWKDGMFNAILTYNINGPMGGTYSWIMGPTSWTAMDQRPGEGDHDEDWKKADEHVDAYLGTSYWKLSDELSHIAREELYPKRLIWVYDIKPGQGERWSEMVGQVKEVYKQEFPEESYWVVWNQFLDSNKGWDAAVIWGFDKWAWMDVENAFDEAFERVHGEDTWGQFLADFMETINGRVDWIREVVD